MKLLVTMDSGKEYTVQDERDHVGVSDFVDSLFNPLPQGRIMANTFMYIDDNEMILINPTHISSIEVIED
ncbi:hypothetical protein ACIQLG_19775 [Terribacillus saccharophilus]|uniref:hypothetical protein n=1 Tax=Terribacillus saccharophilus TaxID=361277 RepID=UPI0037F4DB3E